MASRKLLAINISHIADRRISPTPLQSHVGEGQPRRTIIAPIVQNGENHETQPALNQRLTLTVRTPRGTLGRPRSRGPLRITLNGEPYELDEPLSVADLLMQLSIDPRRVAIEHNLTILKRQLFDDTLVHEGDRIEIVNFVGGG